MALNFPDSPVAGTVFGAWRYDGVKWGAVSGVSGGGSAGDITAVLAGAGLSGGGTEGDVSIALAVPVTVARGGTGATDAATALVNLGGAPLASPTFTGDPKAPTPATADNDTSIATTAYVKAQGYQTGNQTITLSGDASGSGTTAITTTLATVNANVGTFQGLTVNAKGLVTAAASQSYLTAPVNLTSQVTGTLPVANGGTGAASLTANAILTGNGTSAVQASGASVSAGNLTAAGTVTANSVGGNSLVANSPTDTDNFLQYSVGAQRQWKVGIVGSTKAYLIFDGTAGAARLQIDTTGACFSTNGTWSSLSDRALKENITPYTRGLAAIIQLEPVSFTYVAGTPFAEDGAQRFGLIAQDVALIVPEVVGETEVAVGEQAQAVATLEAGNLIYALINAVKELEARLRALEAPV